MTKQEELIGNHPENDSPFGKWFSVNDIDIRYSVKKCKLNRLISILMILISISVLTSSCNKENSKSNKEVPFYVEIKQSDASVIDILIKYLKEGLIIFGMGAGIVLGYPALRKKLREDHIKKLLLDTQEANKEVRIYCHDLIDKYTVKTYDEVRVKKIDVRYILFNLYKLNKISLNSNKEVVTLSYLLKLTFERLISDCDFENNYSRIYTREIYNLLIRVLLEVIFFSEKIVTIPWNNSTKKIRYLKPEIGKYISNNTFKKYRYFEQGFDGNVLSPVFMHYFAKVSDCKSSVFHLSVYKIYNSPIPMARLVYFSRIYYPLVLVSKEQNIFHEYDKLHMISFKVSTELFSNKKTIKFTYANLFCIDSHYEQKEDNLKKNFVDDYIDSKGVDLSDICSFKNGKDQLIVVEVGYEKAEELFNKNKKKLRKQMKSELKEGIK